jgi:hypothetical protein
MSIFRQRPSAVTDTITSLNIRIRELERLRDQVKKAHYRPEDRGRNPVGKEREFRMTRAASVGGIFMRAVMPGRRGADETILALSRNRRSSSQAPKSAGSSHELCMAPIAALI